MHAGQRGVAGNDAAGVDGGGETSSDDLSGTTASSKLLNGLEDLTESRGSEGVASSHKPSAGVDADLVSPGTSRSAYGGVARLPRSEEAK